MQRRKTKFIPVLSFLIVLSAIGLLWGQGRADRDIVYSDDNGTCVLSSSPTRIVAKRNFVIVWHVKNNCTSEITVNVGNFRLQGSPEEPLDLEGAATVRPGRQRPIRGTVKGVAQFGTYEYDVSLEGGAPEDPELVINP